MFNYSNAIMEEGGPKIAGVNDVLDSGHTGEVDTVGAYMVIIKVSFSLIRSEEAM